ncbi:MAG: hypothetical protein GEV06_19790 [Luteitalea sp.]|nr:hypothetical protein [Luteitalea sp.]
MDYPVQAEAAFLRQLLGASGGNDVNKTLIAGWLRFLLCGLQIDDSGVMTLSVPPAFSGLNLVDVNAVTLDGWEATQIQDAVNVVFHGAVGDGVTDDTAAIQAAITAAASQAVFFPQGTYLVSGSLTGITSGSRLFGANAVLQQTAAFAKTIALSGVSDIDIRGLQFVGLGTEHNGANTSFNGVAAVYMLNCARIQIGQCRMTNHAGGAIRWQGTMDGLQVYNNTIVGIGAAGGIQAGDNNADVAVGSWTTTQNDNIVITDNDISGHCFGVAVGEASSAVISSNHVHDIPGQHAIYLNSAGETVVSGNVIRDIAFIGIKNQINGTDVVVADDVVEGNLLHACGQTGISVDTTAGSTGCFFDRVTIRGNHITAVGTDYGIAVGDNRDVVIEGNYIQGTGAYGIYFLDSHGWIRHNVIHEANWTSIFGAVTHDTEVVGNSVVDGVLNAEAGADNNRYRYLLHLTDSTKATVANPQVLLTGNVFRFTVAEPTLYLNAVRLTTDLRAFLRQNDNFTTKPMTFSTGVLQHYAPGVSHLADLQVSADLNPTTPLYGTGRRWLYGTQDPAAASMTATFRAGDVCWNATPTSGEAVGWVCTSSGAPGTWAPFAGVNIYDGSNLTLSGDLIHTATPGVFRANTSDGADSSYVAVVGGGAATQDRGAMLRAYGNEDASSPGRVSLTVGNVANSKFEVLGADGGADLTIDGATGAAAFTSSVKSSSATAGIGYATGAGSTVTQLTSKATGVTINTVTGQITSHNASVASGVGVGFSVTNSAVAATDVILLSVGSGASNDSYRLLPNAVSAGSFRITIENRSGGALGEAVVINFAVIKGVAA